MFAITDTKCYVVAATLSTQDNEKLIEKLKSGFSRTINWKKSQTERSREVQDPYLEYLIHPSFQTLNRLFVIPFQDMDMRLEMDREDIFFRL